MNLTIAANRYRIAILLAFLFIAHSRAYSSAPKQEFYFIKIYQLKTKEQEEKVDKYLQAAFLPALHRMGISQVGVFKPLGNDTAAIRRVYVLIPIQSMKEFLQLPQQLEKDNQYLSDGKDYLDAVYNEPPYARIETVLLQAFPGMPRLQSPGEALKSAAKSDRVYELRSYEGPTEKLYQNKVQMFNQGDEIGLFKRLGFNAVFYASVLSGSHMPNLMYMTTFENMAARDQHWKAFGSDPYWKKLAAAPEYQHNVSKSEILFLHPAEYSDL
jgi:hypothetical protein